MAYSGPSFTFSTDSLMNSEPYPRMPSPDSMRAGGDSPSAPRAGLLHHLSTPTQHGRNSSSMMTFSPQPHVDPILIDNLARDLKLDDVQTANLHAFVKVRHDECKFYFPAYSQNYETLQMGSCDGMMAKSDLITRLYMLAAIYADAAERRRVEADRGFKDLKDLFADLKIRLEGTFTLTKEQSVSHFMFKLSSQTQLITGQRQISDG